MKNILILFTTLVLTGCSTEHRAALNYAADQAKNFSDTEAKILLRAPCAIRIGAYWRVLDEGQRSAVNKLCGK